MFGTQFGKSLGTVVVLFLATILVSAQTPSSANDWKPVEEAMGRTGQVSGDVIRFGHATKGSSRNARGRGNQARSGARLLGGIQERRKFSHGDGRSSLNRK